MEGTYEICMSGKRLGTVRVQRVGLYVSFSCRCELSGEGMYEVMLRCGGRVICLGLLAPTDGRFGLEKRLSASSLGQEEPEFFLQSRYAPQTDRFVPIRPEEPFAFLALLADARMAVREGEVGLLLPAEK